jgi:hypothetical protein
MYHTKKLVICLLLSLVTPTLPQQTKQTISFGPVSTIAKLSLIVGAYHIQKMHGYNEPPLFYVALCGLVLYR